MNNDIENYPSLEASLSCVFSQNKCYSLENCYLVMLLYHDNNELIVGLVVQTLITGVGLSRSGVTLNAYWQRIIQEVKHRHDLTFDKYFVHFPEMEEVNYHRRKCAACRATGYSKRVRYYIDNHNTYLTEREYQAVDYIVAGVTYRETALQMRISPRTLEVYVSNMKQKMHCFSRKQLERKLQQAKFTPRYRYVKQ